MSTTLKDKFTNPFEREDPHHDIGEMLTRLELAENKMTALIKMVQKMNEDGQQLRRLRNQVRTLISRGSLVPECRYFKTVPEDGILLRYFFVSPATVRNGGVFIGQGPARTDLPIAVRVVDKNKVEHTSHVTVRTGYSSFDINMRVDVGSTVEVVAELPWPADVNDIWIGFISEVFLCAS